MFHNKKEGVARIGFGLESGDMCSTVYRWYQFDKYMIFVANPNLGIL